MAVHKTTPYNLRPQATPSYISNSVTTHVYVAIFAQANNVAKTMHLTRIKTMAAADYIPNLVDEVLAWQSKSGTQQTPNKHSKATTESELARRFEKLLLRRTMASWIWWRW